MYKKRGNTDHSQSCTALFCVQGRPSGSQAMEIAMAMQPLYSEFLNGVRHTVGFSYGRTTE